MTNEVKWLLIAAAVVVVWLWLKKRQAAAAAPLNSVTPALNTKPATLTKTYRADRRDEGDR